ncbi:hypothetical protein LUZ60_015860 [Juncus effusus]|nr:hypothetical protein LUZ60_015860 [Juncus effusus]
MAGGTGEAGEESMTEYERQRLARMRENKARMEALGLRGLSSSLQTNSESPTNKRKKKKKRVEEEEEEEYRPSDEEEEEEMEAEETSVSREEEREGSKKKKKGPPKSSGNGNDCGFVDEDTALAQAIALSLNESVKNSDLKETKVSQLGKINVTGKESPRKRNMKKPNKSGIKLTEDEVIAFFFTLDEAGKGYITASDIEKMAIIHDFTWTDFEIAKMVHCFDSDGDRKLSLADFRSIVSRCNMSQET